MCLSVRYRNHFPVVRFQNQVHIWNPHGTGQVFKPFGAPKAPRIFLFILSPPPKAAVAQMGAPGALTGAPKAPRTRRAREIPPKAGVLRVLIWYVLINFQYVFIFLVTMISFFSQFLVFMIPLYLFFNLIVHYDVTSFKYFTLKNMQLLWISIDLVL